MIDNINSNTSLSDSEKTDHISSLNEQKETEDKYILYDLYFTQLDADGDPIYVTASEKASYVEILAETELELKESVNEIGLQLILSDEILNFSQNEISFNDYPFIKRTSFLTQFNLFP